MGLRQEFCVGLVVLDHGSSLSLFKNGGVCDDGANEVWVDVGSGSSVLDVTLSVIVSGLSGDRERCSSVSSSVAEFAEAGGLVNTSESVLVANSVHAHVEFVSGLESGHHIFDVLHSLGAISHRLGGEVGVAS